MSEARIAAVEAVVTELRIEQARMSESVEHLSSTVKDLAVAVKELTTYMNRGRGALWVFGVMSATAGGIISWVTTLIFQR